MSGTDDYYVLLEISPTASEDTIRGALRDQQRKWSKRQSVAPNLKDRQEAEQRVQRLKEARQILLDPAAKARYDQSRIGRPSPPFPPQHQFEPPQPPQTDRISPPISPPPQPPPQPPQVGGRVPLRRRKWFRWTVGVFAVLIVISAIDNANKQNGGSGGSGSQSLPSGATRAAVLGPVVAALESCARSAVLQPANCPQQASSSSGTAVVWALHGNPTAGAQISTSGSQVTVLGNSVMGVHYSDSSGSPQFELVKASYQATLHWDGHHATVTAMAQDQNNPDTSITQPRPSVSDGAVKATAKAFFTSCAALTTVQPPVECFQSSNSLSSSDTQIHYSLTADPLLNSSVTYDANFGVLHVVGSYAYTVKYVDSSGSPQSQNFQGTYDAAVTDDHGRLTAVEITTSS